MLRGGGEMCSPEADRETTGNCGWWTELKKRRAKEKLGLWPKWGSVDTGRQAEWGRLSTVGRGAAASPTWDFCCPESIDLPTLGKQPEALGVVAADAAYRLEPASQFWLVVASAFWIAFGPEVHQVLHPGFHNVPEQNVRVTAFPCCIYRLFPGAGVPWSFFLYAWRFRASPVQILPLL